MPYPLPRSPSWTSSLALAVIALAAAACSSDKNHAERDATVIPRPANCVDRCQPDPGSPPADCAAAEFGLEFAPIWTFDGSVASGLYVYDDGATDLWTSAFRTPIRTDASVPPEWGPWPDGWEPNTETANRCSNAGATGVLHIAGGPFRGWGGGVGGRATVANGGALLTSCGAFDTCRPSGAEFPQDLIDLTQWEGIAFWGRRGPDGQANLRVAVGDKYTDDDLSYATYRDEGPEAPRHCERHRECGCRSRPCTPYVFPGTDTPEYYCWDPELGDPEPVEDLSAGDRKPVTQYDACGTTECEMSFDPFPGEADPQTVGRPCTTHRFRGGIVRDFCFDPETDPPPVEGDELCGDHWLAPVTLTPQWQFFTVPFNKLLQQGWAKEQHLFDLTAVSLFRLTFDKGWVDFYIDDVKLYRALPPL